MDASKIGIPISYDQYDNKLRNTPLFYNTYNDQLSSLNTRYFSSADAEIWFNDEIFIDNVVQITWQLQQNVQPLIGFNSYTIDDYSIGSRLITGTFAVNFTKANYLEEVLSKLRTITMIQADSTEYNDNEYLDSTETPLWKKNFDIVVSYGGTKTQNAIASTSMTLVDVQITGCSQQIDSNGIAIIENYSFMAKDIQHAPVDKIASNQVTPETTEIINVIDSRYYEEIVSSVSTGYTRNIINNIIEMKLNSLYEITSVKWSPIINTKKVFYSMNKNGDKWTSIIHEEIKDDIQDYIQTTGSITAMLQIKLLINNKEIMQEIKTTIVAK